MKKIIKILISILLVILILLVTIPIVFKKQLITIVKEQINNNLNAKVDFSDFKLSFIRNFPNAYIAIEDLSVVGVDKFKGDTLVSFKMFSVTTDIISAIKMDEIKIKSILLDKPHMNAIILQDSSVNWDIMKPDTAAIESAVDTSEATKFKIQLKKFEIRNADITYDDKLGDMKAIIKNLNFVLKGDMTQDKTTLDIVTTIDKLDYFMTGIKYLNKSKIGFKAKIAADMVKSLYMMQENEMYLNDLVMTLNGSVLMPNDDIVMDLKFNTKKTDFKSLLSLVPAVYMKDFKDVQTTGNLALSGSAKGTYNEKSMPIVDLKLLVENAMFKYPSMPKSADKINIDLMIHYDGVNADKTIIDLKKFHVEMAGNPIDATLLVKTPETDAQINSTVNGSLDLKSIKDIIPLENTTINGLFSAAIKLDGKMSSIEAEKYEEFNATGTFSLTNFSYKSADFPQGVYISETEMLFSPKFVDLTKFVCKIGKSDIRLTGKIENFIAYTFSDGILKGNYNFNSTILDLNEFMSDEESTATTTETVDTASLTVFEVPKNMDIRLTSSIGKILYDKLIISNTTGAIDIKDQKVLLSNLNMFMLQGSMIMNGEYNTQNIKEPSYNFNMKISDFDIPSTYNSFTMIQQMAPITKNCVGKFSSDLMITSTLDQHMMPVYSTLYGKGKLQSKNVVVNGSKTFEKIATILKNDEYKRLALSDLNLSFEIKNGRVYLDPPFTTSLGANKLMVSGDQGIDQTMNYTINMNMPKSAMGSAANGVINGLIASAGSKGITVDNLQTINLDILVSGTFDDPKVRPVFKDGGKAVESVKQQVQQKVEQTIDQKKEQAKAAAKAQADKLISDAESQAAKIRSEGKSLADKTRQETNAAANKLVKEANNPIAKKAAEVTAKKMKEEGEKKAKTIENESDSKANAVIQKARDEAARLQ